MKDSNSLTSEMINRNWVLKRKRRKISSGGDTSKGSKSIPIPLESELQNTSSRGIVNGEIMEDILSDKKKGDDGHYYECEICDLGGDLLCCDSCPKTYHLQCLDPPLKRIPTGRWQCHSCCQENTSDGKSKTETKKKKTSGKGKSSTSRRKPNSPVKIKINKKKKSVLLPANKLEEEKTSSPVEEDKDLNKIEVGGEQLLLLEGTLRKVRKRKRKIVDDVEDDFVDRKKKCKSSKGKCSKESEKTNQSKTKATRSSGKPKRKNKSSSKSIKDETLDTNMGDEIVLEEAAELSVELFESGKNSVGAFTYESDDLNPSQQVDRVLGCRVQGTDLNLSIQTSMNGNGPVSADLLALEQEIIQAEENPNHDTTLEVSENADQSIFSQSDGEQCVEEDEGMEKVNAGVTSKSESLTEVMKDSESHVSPELPDLKADRENEQDKKSEKVPTEEIADVALKTESLPEVTKDPNLPVSPEILANMANCEGINDSAILKPASSNGETTSYEFLVKWVGKSHIHNTWISESKLKLLAKRKYDNYKFKFGNTILNISEERWKIPQRVIALRTLKDGTEEAFVKWTALGYEECTWEKTNELVIAKSSNLIDLFMQFEQQSLEKESNDSDLIRGKFNFEVVTLTEQPKYLMGGLLFPHQLEALNWLRKCWFKSRNVILADEMGLGKTVSACAFISSLYFEFKAKSPCLVLVPLSTMPNWMSEFSLWAPNLNVVEYHGSAKARTILRQYEWHRSQSGSNKKKSLAYKFHVILTTYEMVLVDSNHLRGVPWEVLVVDEGHRLKNSSSKLFGMLNTFSFQHRVLLTGTPLQNNIGEMYNLLNFLQPSSFPSLSLFEDKFNDLTTAEKVDELKKLVAPHMLRRLKKDAMQNIPPKTERMVPVELSSIQAEYYRAMLTKNYQILRNIGKGVAQQSMLNIVMQLRKVCNHPYLIPGTEPESGTVEFLQEMRIKASAKLNLLHSMLKVLHKEGHRVLIFSQMTKLLDILEDYMTIEFGPKTFERVDGSVSVADRQTAIARFNQDKTRFVFLLSTRSCGLGINLATADTVIIYDSDFNPHADIQAMNRAHRIGQSNRLLVYRLVVRASVEERILQLAKKKLMLDQLFVNKSGSQKEVEDIIRWGTEELFNDSLPIGDNNNIDTDNSNIKEETSAVDTEHKSKRRTGGLGDVYTDKCTDGSTKIVWDENAIMKLLDRSNLQSGIPDNTYGDLENDMLGSVKSIEWNEETIEEHGGTELLPVADEDGSAAQISEKKDEASANGVEENEWDKLLRVRWEKYQTEEEAALGRGKRLRKAVSYREAYAVVPNETLNESGGEEKEPEIEPLEREYTSAGRVLKEKYTKLRARQKERLAKRNEIDQVDELARLEPVPQLAAPFDHDVSLMARLDELVKDKATKMKSEINKNCQSPEQARVKTVKVSSKHKSASSQIPVVDQSNMDLLPVLGLCAPNAKQHIMVESSSSSPQKNVSRKQNHRRESGSDYRFRLAPCSVDLNDIKNPETISDKFKFHEAGPSEAFKQEMKNNGIPNHFLPFNLQPFADPQAKFSDRLQNYGANFADFQEKMSLPKLPFDEKLLPRYPFLPRNPHHPHPHPDMFAGLSLGDPQGSHREIPTMPFLPSFNFPHQNPNPSQYHHHHHHEQETPPHMQQPFASFPESHRKVLENILLRTGTGPGPGSSTTNLLKRNPIIKDIWSEDELDSLWLGFRRHGKDNWEAILRDSRSKFSKFKTAEDLAVRWEEEQHKYMDGYTPKQIRPTKSKSPLLPGITDGMMARALQGSRFSGPLKFRTHLTDMKLGFNDLQAAAAAAASKFEPLDQVPAIPSWKPDLFKGNFSVNSISDRPGTSVANLPFEQQFMSNNSFGHTGLGLNNFELQQRENANRYAKLPTFLDNSLNLLRETHNFGTGITESSKGKNILYANANEEASKGNSSNNKLPHWLQEAVKPPSSRPPPEPQLPPTVSAIAQSVRLLYEVEKPSFPPFVAPGLPPCQPKDPRLTFKKKKKQKLYKHRNFPKVGSPSITAEPIVDPVGPSQVESDPDRPPVQKTETLSGVSPSPEVLQLVTACIDEGLKDRIEIKTGKQSLPGVKREECKSRDSSKTVSDPNRVNPVDVAESSSEETVSDDRTSDKEA
jgi:chromodomain-helicase-DNA-binding protein 4